MTDEPSPRPRRDSRADDITRKLLADAIAHELPAIKLRLEALEQRPAGGGGEAQASGHAEEHEALRKTLDKLEAAHDAAPPAFQWDDLDDDDRAQREHDLSEWVDGWLAYWCPRSRRVLLPCWWQHPDVRWSVTAAWLAWVGAHQADTRRRSDPAIWLKDHLPAMEKQVTAVLGSVPEFGKPQPCDDHRQPPPPTQ